MKLVVGLGNPGREYENTRHNAGFFVIDRLIARHAPGVIARGKFNALAVDTTINGEKTLLLKPTTYMNLSGRSVSEAVRFYKLDPTEDLLVLVDETALDVGTLRFRAQGSDGGHNGLADIQQMLATDSYCRCRIGIGPRGIIPQKDYVLGKFTEEQSAALEPVFERVADASEHWVESGITSTMNRFNTKPEPKAKPAARKKPDTERETRPDAPDQPGPPETSQNHTTAR